MKSRNPIARTAWKFNKPKIVKAKKGKGSYNRKSHKEDHKSKNDLPYGYLLYA